ncbi:MAG TPA: DUF72 domain-containing protein [Acetobacteraceae bacterium]|nr:DUF72 domain-containing protein [Acetobacteraceae bacterium]
MEMEPAIHVGTAGWSIPKQHAASFPAEGSHLERYAARFSAVEINSSFYRPHRPATYARWAASVPSHFRFAVKAPREITHERRLADAAEPLERFLSEVAALGDCFGPLLVQLPPSLRFDEQVGHAFFNALRHRFAGEVVCEPRHASWFADAADDVLRTFRVGRVAADPAPVPAAARPGGWPGIVYVRLHGSPKMYYSPYSSEQLDSTADLLREAAAEGRQAWCIFDNTALGEATGNALDLLGRL